MIMLQATVGIHEDALCKISLFIRKISVRAYYNAMLVQRINFVDMYVCMYVCMCVCACVRACVRTYVRMYVCTYVRT